MSADPHAVVVWQRPGNGQAYPISLFLGFYDKPIREILHIVPVDKFIPFCFAFGKVPYL
jgi:hypothetical protein